MSLISPSGSHLVHTSVEFPLLVRMTLCFISVPSCCDQPLCMPAGSLLEKKWINSSHQIKPRHVSMAGSAQALLRHTDRSAPGFSPAAESCLMPLTGSVSSQILLAHPAAGTTSSVTLSEHKCKRLSSLAHCNEYQVLKFLKRAKPPQDQRMLCRVMRFLLQKTSELGRRKRHSQMQEH